MPLRHLDSDAKAIVNLADRIAHECGEEYVGTEHILLALLRHNGGLGARVLKQLGVDEDRVKTKVGQIAQRAKEDTWVFGRLPGSPHYRKVIELAIDEAGRHGAPEIGTEHLLLALLREHGTTAQRALAELGVTLAACRAALPKTGKT